MSDHSSFSVQGDNVILSPGLSMPLSPESLGGSSIVFGQLSTNLQSPPTTKSFHLPHEVLQAIIIACHAEDEDEEAITNPDQHYLDFLCARIGGLHNCSLSVHHRSTQKHAILIEGIGMQAARHKITRSSAHSHRLLIHIPKAYSKEMVSDGWLADQIDADCPAFLQVHSDKSIELTGSWAACEKSRLMVQAVLDRQLGGKAVERLQVGIEQVPAIMGPLGRHQLEVQLNTGCWIDVEAALIPRGQRVLVTVTGQGSEKVAAEIQSCSPGIVRTMQVPPRGLSQLITQHPRQIARLLHRHGVAMEFDLKCGQCWLHGMQEGALEQAEEAIKSLLYSRFHRVNFWMLQVDSSTLMSIVAAIGGIEAWIWKEADGQFRVELTGSMNALQACLACLEQYPVIAWQWLMLQPSSQREFISGKRDGKLQKIIRETGASIQLTEVNQAEMEVEIAAEIPSQLAMAVEMTKGELPAELWFHLPEVHHRRLIGHGGETIQRVMKKHAVFIKFLNANEARQQHGNTSARLPNVLIRTPAKNAAVLPMVREEVLSMAEDSKNASDEQGIPFSRAGMIALSEASRAQLAQLIRSYQSSLEMGLTIHGALWDADEYRLKLNGSSAACQKFLAALPIAITEGEKVALFGQQAEHRSDSLEVPSSPVLSDASEPQSDPDEFSLLQVITERQHWFAPWMPADGPSLFSPTLINLKMNRDEPVIKPEIQGQSGPWYRNRMQMA